MGEFMAWFQQAQADWEAAESLASSKTSKNKATRPKLNVGNRFRRSDCHAIAKWQQTVEKAIKAIVACLRDAGILHIEIGYQHGVERFVRVLVRLPLERKQVDSTAVARVP